MPTVTDVRVEPVPTGNAQTGGWQVFYTKGEGTDGVRIEVSSAGTRDALYGMYVDRESPYANVVPYGTYDFYVAPWGGGVIGAETPVLGVAIEKSGGTGGKGQGQGKPPKGDR